MDEAGRGRLGRSGSLVVALYLAPGTPHPLESGFQATHLKQREAFSKKILQNVHMA